jgi:hypothetical protein
MTMLTYAHSRSQGCGSESKAKPDTHAAGTSTAGSNLNLIKRVGEFAFAVTLVTTVLAAIIALDASVYLARFSH